MTMRFRDRVVVVTGAGGGLGRAAALGFAREGARLVITDIAAGGVEETAAMILAEGGECLATAFDLGAEPEITRFGTETCARHPRIHLLYNNAGIAYGEINQPIDTIGQERWLRYLAVNSIAPMLLAQALRPSLRAAKGVILNQSSMAASSPGNAYGITKATLNAVTYAMASSFGPEGIRVNAIAPGLMETDAARDGLPPAAHERIRAMQMLDGSGTAEDIVRLALFLASDEVRFITGEIVACDAGNRVRGWRY